MKNVIIFVLFLMFIGSGYYFFIHQEKSNLKGSPDHTEKEVVENKFQVNNAPIVHDYYSLWKGEAASASLYPEGLDELENNDESATYINHWFGYEFDYPKEWEVDNHQVPYYTRFFTPGFRLDITVQNVDKAWTTPGGYIQGTIANLKPYITSDNRWDENGFNIRNIDYQRPIIEGIETDLNYYSYYFVTKYNHVYTFQLKTDSANFNQAKEEMDRIIDSFSTFKMIEKDLDYAIKKQPPNPEIKLAHKAYTLDIPKNHFLLGVYLNETLKIKQLEADLQSPLGAQMFYKPIDSTYDEYTEQLLKEGRLPVVTFLFEKTNSQENTDVAENILSGTYNENLLTWVKEIKEIKGPVLLRIGNEMNGAWSDWSHEHTYNDPDLYKLTFTHIAKLFEQNEVDNAYFVWNPNHVSDPYFEWNNAHIYYPGDKYVDFVGMTAYNYGKTKWNDYQSFDTLYEELYWDYSRSFFNKPLMIGEFGSEEFGGDKAKWIEDFFWKIPNKYPNIKMAIWFDHTHEPYDLRIRTTPASTQAFQRGMQQESVIKKVKVNKKKKKKEDKSAG